ncbi:MAG: hypothetical protein ACN4GW_01855 [Desulforhopalus sp.]
MRTQQKRLPPLFIAACIIFAAGVACLGLSFTLQLELHIFKGMLYISFSFLTFGIGEIINHPKQRLVISATEKDKLTRQVHRKRSVCSLGNLCDIIALLLFFVGLATLLYTGE